MRLRFQLNYKFQGPNAPFLFAADAGYFAAAGIECSFLEGISSSLVTRPLAEGSADVGFGDVSSVMEHALRTGKDDVVCLMPIYERTPCCLAYRGKPDSLRLEELRNKRLAGPKGDTSARLLPLLLEKNGLSDLPYELLTVTSEERDRMIDAGEVAAITCFDATLLFSMQARGYSTDDLSFFYYADHGLDIYSSALICRRAVLDTAAGLAEALTTITRRAWADCREDRDLGVKAVMARAPRSDPEIVRGHLSWVLDHQVFPSATNEMAWEPTGIKIGRTFECARRIVGAAGQEEPRAVIYSV